MMNKLLNLLDDFIEEKNASWNRDEWLLLVNKVNINGIEIKDSELKKILENKKDIYLAKKQGLSIISKSELIKLCKKFIEQHGITYSESQWNDFLVNVGIIGYYNKTELLYYINIEKENYTKSHESVVIGKKHESKHKISE